MATPNASIQSKTGNLGITRVGPTKGASFGTNTDARGTHQAATDNKTK